MNTMSSEVGPTGESSMYTRPRPNPEPDPEPNSTEEHTMTMYTLGGGTESSSLQYHQAKTIYLHTLHAAHFFEYTQAEITKQQIISQR